MIILYAWLGIGFVGALANRYIAWYQSEPYSFMQHFHQFWVLCVAWPIVPYCLTGLRRP